MSANKPVYIGRIRPETEIKLLKIIQRETLKDTQNLEYASFAVITKNQTKHQMLSTAINKDDFQFTLLQLDLNY